MKRVGFMINGEMIGPRSRIVRCARGLLLATFCAALTLFTPSALAVITYVGKSSAADSSGSTRVVLALPAGTATNDLMLVGISVKPGVTITTPAGWILIRNDVGNDPNQYSYYKFRTLGEVAVSYTFVFSASSQGAGGMMVFSGVDLVSPIEASSGSSSPAGAAQTCNIAGANKTIDPMQAPYLGSPGAQYLPSQGALLVGFFSNGQDKTNITPPPLITTTAACTQDAAGTPAWTETIQQKSGGGGGGFTLEGSYQPTLCSLSGVNCTGTRTAYATNNTGSADIAQMFALRPLGVINHYYVTNSATGVNCQAENVTITAHDSTHNPVVLGAGAVITVTAQFVSGAGVGNRGDWSIVSGGGAINNGTADDGVATFTFPGGTSSVVLALKDTWAQTVNIVVTDGTAGDTSGTASADVGYNQNLAFSAAGFRFIDASSNPMSSQMQTAGTPSGQFYLQAIQSTGCATPGACTGVCSGVFANNASVSIGLASECVNPSTCAGRQISINGTPINNYAVGALGSYTAVPLTFGANSSAPFTLTYPDVGQMRLDASYNIPLGTGGASSNNITGTGAPFVVKPFGFTVSGIQTTAGAIPNPAATDATGSVFIRAGSNFTATVTAIVNGGAAAPNYGKESPAETVKLTANLVGGLGLINNPALTNPTAFGAFSGGSATGTTFAWGDVGIITLSPSVGDGDYLGAGDVTGTASGNVGRFIPDHFALSGASLTNRSTSACSPASTFTYMNEPMRLGFTLTAQGPSPGNATLLNYVTSATPANNFANLGTAAPIPAAFGFGLLNGTTDLSTRLDSSLGITGNWSAGVLNATATLAFSRSATQDGPYPALQIGLAPTDSDGVQLLSAALNMDITAPVGNDHAQAALTQVRFGRLTLGNAFGSELLDLPIPMETQYYTSSNGLYVTNVEDSCTTLSASDLALAFVSGTPNLVACETSIAPVTTIYFTSGKASATAPPATTPLPRLTKPGAGNNGAVDITVNLGSASGNTCLAGTSSAATGANKTWLQWKWSGSTFDKNPTGRATFGIYKNADEFIYLRENF